MDLATATVAAWVTAMAVAATVDVGLRADVALQAVDVGFQAVPVAAGSMVVAGPMVAAADAKPFL